jgi:RND family efflux transporter MFP subunit
MRLSSFHIGSVLLTLATGITVGALVFRNSSATLAAIVRPTAATSPSSSVAIAVSEGQETPLQARLLDSKYLSVVFARQTADIVARSEGILESVYVNIGDRLKAGDIIARAETYSISQRLQMAEATLRLVKAEQHETELELEDAQTRYQRREELAESGLISREDLATAKLQVDRAEAKLQAAKARVTDQMARVNEAEESLAQTTITAAFAGTVAARYLDAGAAVRSGTPIVSLIRPEDLWVRFAIPQTAEPLTGLGSVVEFQLEGSPIGIPGRIEYVSPAMAAASQELLVEARLKVPAASRDQIRPGATGLVSLQAR